MAQTLTWTNLKKINFSQSDDFSTIQKYICPLLSKKKQAKPTQSQPVTKTDSFGFNHDAELLCKKWSQKTNPFWSIFWKRIKQSDWQREFWHQKTRARLVNCLNNWLHLQFLWLPTHEQKISIIAQNQSWHIADSILVIILPVPRCVWPHLNFPWILNHMWKNQLYSSTHSWDKIDSLFGMTLVASRHARPHPLGMTE